MTSDAPVAAVETSVAHGRAPMSFKYKLLLILTSLVLMGVLRTGFMFVIIGLLPSVVAYYMDVAQGRYTFKTVFACNLSGLLPYLGKMLEHGPSRNAVLQQIMGDLNNWIIIYGAALLGMLLLKICPMIAQFMVLGFAHTNASRIKTMQRNIEAEWGTEVTQFSQPIEDD